ncbi:RNA 3'-terminal phosphate cyclase [Pseudodesulfovibrio sediminis]|uniref:RNA 3'-terminal phosphate cyclase n=1 Tax=Pseudodesulfovibrio sediminis TaxID=2810563 RepID=A0ABN6ERG7_9BACT|nr:RNA 3'-terminal phosphate cyclase [Pseudodesulfovibrio sediminis]BCS88988.1 RNA 3'-terminal phosphate cyclase [Pseudodesulfovibrio sediminis]
MIDSLKIDGSFGEGGGQVLRSSLTLSMVTGKPVHVINIRNGRAKPGLMRQHLTALKAAAEVCGAEVQGHVVGSTEIRFSPGPIQGGHYDFAVGTAGSAGLVLQTVLPALLLAENTSTITVEGGTHNMASPPFDFLERCYLPAVEAMGPSLKVHLKQYGFYPVGGGRFTVNVTPVEQLRRVEFLESADCKRILARSCVARISKDICKRELEIVKEGLGLAENDCSVEFDLPSPGPGNYLFVEVHSENALPACFTAFGRKGVTAEQVAAKAVKDVKMFLDSGAVVERQLADQLLLPMVLAGGGSFRTTKPSMHTLTNIEVIRQFIDLPIEIKQESEGVWRIDLGKE